MIEKMYGCAVTVATKADGRVIFTITQNTGHVLKFDLTEADATTLASAITTALA